MLVLKQEQLLFHGLPLQDGINAISMKDNNWGEATDRVAKFLIRRTCL